MLISNRFLPASHAVPQIFVLFQQDCDWISFNMCIACKTELFFGCDEVWYGIFWCFGTWHEVIESYGSYLCNLTKWQNVITTHQRSGEGNVFNRVCLSIHWRGRYHVTIAHDTKTLLPDMFKLVGHGRHCSGNPSPGQTCLLWSTYSWLAGGRRTTGMLSCSTDKIRSVVVQIRKQFHPKIVSVALQKM